MRAIQQTMIVTSFVALTLTLGRIGAEAQQPTQLGANSSNTSPVDAQAEVGQLRMSIRVSAPESTASLRLHLTFENESDKDTVVNLGTMLANGKVHLPDAIRLFLADSGGHARELHFSDKKYPGIAGRVDDYAVPLRAGSAYTLKLNLKDYWCPKTKEFTLDLGPDRYSIRAVFTGNSAQHLNGDTEGLKFMPFWTGKLESDVAQFDLAKKG